MASSVLEIRDVTRKSRSSSISTVDMDRSSAHERLRGNHIAMLEMLQQLTDENAMLRMSLSKSKQGTPATAGVAASSGSKKGGLMAGDDVDDAEAFPVADDDSDSSALLMKIAAQDAEIRDLKVRLGAAEDDKKTLKKQLTAAKQEDYESRKKDKAEIKARTEEAESWKLEAERRQQEAMGWEGQRGDLLGALASLTADLNALKTKHVAVLQNTAAIEEKNHALQQRVAELEAELEAVEGDNDELLAQAGALQERADAASRVADAVGADAAGRANTLEAANTALREDIDALRAALATAEAGAAAAAEECGRRGAAVDRLEEEVARLQAALDAAADAVPQSSFFLTTTSASARGPTAPTQAQTAVVLAKGLRVLAADRSVDGDGDNSPAPAAAQVEASCCAVCQAVGNNSSGSPFDQFISLKKENRQLKLQLAAAVAQGRGAKKG